MSREGKYTGKTQPRLQGVSFCSFSDFDAKMAPSIYFNFYWSVKYNPDIFENGDFFSVFDHQKRRFSKPVPKVFFLNARLSFSCRWTETEVFEYGDVICRVTDAIFFPLFLPFRVDGRK